MPKKIREIKQIATKVGYVLQKKRGKGSHSYWTHPLIPSMPLTIPGKDGDDAPKYLETQITKALEVLKNLEDNSND
jgi:predicted RNA binding protein YcfA (HicA-like mRNA interferase family)